MTIASLKIESNAMAREEVLGVKDVRSLIAHQLGVDVKRVTDGHGRRCRIHVFGDLIRHLKSARVAKGDDAAVASHEPTIGLSMPDAVNLPFTARNGTTRAFARTMAKSFSARFRH
jgi:hypothetical protein